MTVESICSSTRRRRRIYPTAAKIAEAKRTPGCSVSLRYTASRARQRAAVRAKHPTSFMSKCPIKLISRLIVGSAALVSQKKWGKKNRSGDVHSFINMSRSFLCDRFLILKISRLTFDVCILHHRSSFCNSFFSTM